MFAVTNFVFYFVLVLCFVRQGWLLFFGTCLSGPEEHSKKEGEDNLVFPPLCTEC